jgi:chromosome segregation ATPase
MKYPSVFDEWREEITVELAQAEKELTSALAAVATAEQAARDERSERVAFEDALARHDARQSLAGALAVRLRRHQEKLRAAEAALARARNEVESQRRRVADLRDAITQIDEIAPAEEAEAA